MTRCTITWDRWAVPTITADDEIGVTYGQGYAQAQTNAALILQIYGVARCRAAEYWGADFLAEDTFGIQLGLPQSARCWLDDQTAAGRDRLQAFCDGFNQACRDDPRLGSGRRQALPVTPLDVVAHLQRVFARFATIDSSGLAWSPQAFLDSAGSNGWAISADLSHTGNALLLINPHLGWGTYHRWFESHSVSPGRDFHGAALLGLPWQTLGHNRRLGWGHTSNTMPALTVYALHVVDDAYRWDGGFLPLDITEHEVAVRDGRPVTVTERRSVHGPVIVAPDGTTVAVRIAGVTHFPVTGALETWWQMSCAGTVKELLARHDRAPITVFNLLAADADGSIAALYCGTPPRTSGSYEDLRRRLPGDDPASLWTAVYGADEMPRAVNPVCGWVQNCNETPWLYTDPPLDPGAWPTAIAPAPGTINDLRHMVSRSWLRSRTSVSPEQLLALKYSKRALLADLVLDELIAAAAAHQDLTAAVEVLTAWDRTAGSNSSGYLLFMLWGMLTAPGFSNDVFSSPAPPGGTPHGLADPERGVRTLRSAVAMLDRNRIPLDATIGQMVAFDDGSVAGDGGSGVLGVLKVLELRPGTDGDLKFVLADTFIARVEFTPDGPVGGYLLPYGNVSEPTSPSAASQHPFWAADTLRPD